jgi:predicted transcriptional regulator
MVSSILTGLGIEAKQRRHDEVSSSLAIGRRQTAMNTLTSRFLSAFARVERYLKTVTNQDHYLTFAALLEEAADESAVIRRLTSTLKDFADLRNVLVHRYDQAKEIAVPSEETVAHLEAIVATLSSPPSLGSLFKGPVEMCRPDEPVGTAAKKMHAHSFSQLPVIANKKIIGLLTADTIARWLATRLEGGIGMLDEEPVEKVLRHQEKTRNYAVMGLSTTVYDALEEFDKSLHSGEFLDAIILTNGGRATEAPIGIVTVSDMPKLVQEAKS